MKKKPMGEAVGSSVDAVELSEAVESDERGPNGAADPTGARLSDAEWLAWARRAHAPVALGRLGPYQLLGEIGRGAQGTVYRARQPGTRREVVIKRLAAGSFAAPRMRARFEREIEVLGALRHPNIVTVHATEIVEHEPILIMEWIEGQPIDRWAGEEGTKARRHKGTQERSGGTRRGMREILELFTRVCDAVQHAHQRGVIHCDLKPSNILVDAQDEPHVLDFGLARLDQAGPSAGRATHTEGFIGTPAFASPEQIGGRRADLDARTDIYSLGVILYEMLTGVWPFAAPGDDGPRASLPDIFDAIRRAAPRSPSRLRAGLSVEIDAILLKAIARDPAQRYQSADALAADIRRFLMGQTVLAHPPTTLYHIRKLISRNRTGFAIGAAVAGVVLLAAVISTIQALQLTEQRNALLASQARERTERLAAERARDQAGAEADKVRATNAFLQTLLTTNDPLLNLRPDTGLRELLDEAGRSLDAGTLADQPDVEAAVRTTIGRTYTSMKMPRQGEPHLRRAMEIREELPQADRAGVADVCSQLALSLSEQRKYEESIPLHRRALALLRSHEPLDEARLIDMLWPFSSALRDHHELPEAEALAREALERSLRLFGPQHVTTAGSRYRLGWILCVPKKLDESELQLREALSIQEALLGAEHPACGETKLRLGNTLAAKGLREDAEPLMREALNILETSLGPDNPRVSRAASNLARLLTRRGGYEEAESIYRLNAARAARYYGYTGSGVANALSQQAHIRGLRGDLPGAESLRREAVRLFKADLGEGHQHTQNERLALADVLVQQGSFAEAEPLLLDVQARAAKASDRSTERGAIDRLIRLYDAWEKAEPGQGKDHEASRWRERSKADSNATTQPG